jgi:hypothetical protein
MSVASGTENSAKTPYTFDQTIGLRGWRFKQTDEQIALCLDWQSIATVNVDYTVFVHVLADTGAPLTQSDAPPKGGRYPTSVWSMGEVITDDCHSFDAKGIPKTGWHVVVGLYDSVSGQRLPALGKDGQHLVDDAAVIKPE